MAATVTLLTDFGSADHFVAAMKGVILARAPGTALVDVTHEVSPQDVRSAAFTLLALYPAFAAGTIHLAVVDPGVGSDRRPIALAAGGQLFVGPDNGIFSYVLHREPAVQVVHLDDPRFFRHPVSTTFHGRDVFAPVAGALAAGVPIAELGSRVSDPVRWEPMEVERVGEGELRAAVLHVDHFGNCITSLAPEHLAEATPAGGFRLVLNGHEVRTLRRFYAEERGDEPFAIWGSAGLLEIACNRSSAARRLGVRRGDPIEVRLG